MDAKTLGIFIAELRKEKGLTQAQLAETLHVTDKAVSRWERGVGLPDLTNLEALAGALDITVTELIQCKRQEEPPVDPETTKQIIDAALDIAKYQRRILLENIIFGLVLFVIGAVILFAAIHALTTPDTGVIIGGADGPTSIFIAGKLPSRIPVTGIVLGALCLLVSLWIFLRNMR